MKLIESNNFSCSLVQAKSRLLKKGILVSTTDDYANIPEAGAKNIKIGIWVHLDHQFQDAILLLKNPNHIVLHPLSQQEMEAIKNAAKEKTAAEISGFFERTATIVTSILLITLAAYISFNILNS